MKKPTLYVAIRRAKIMLLVTLSLFFLTATLVLLPKIDWRTLFEVISEIFNGFILAIFAAYGMIAHACGARHRRREEEK